MTDSRLEPETVTLRLTRRYSASAEALFQAFTDPDLLVQWFGPKGMTVPDCEVDLREGGRWRACMASPEGELHAVNGVYREIRRPNRLVFTWIWEQGDMAGAETLVTLEFVEEGDQAELRLIHEGLPSDTSRGYHELGWTSSFDCLAELLEGTV